MDVFAALADPTRRAILARLAREGRTRVVDLAQNAGMSRPAISRHLRLLTEAGLVTAEDRGRERHYAYLPEGVAPVQEWLTELDPAPAPPIPAHVLDALDLEVRRTVRDHRTQGLHTLGERTPDHGTPSHGLLDESTPEHGAGDKRSPDQRTSGSPSLGPSSLVSSTPERPIARPSTTSSTAGSSTSDSSMTGPSSTGSSIMEETA